MTIPEMLSEKSFGENYLCVLRHPDGRERLYCKTEMRARFMGGTIQQKWDIFKMIHDCSVVVSSLNPDHSSVETYRK